MNKFFDTIVWGFLLLFAVPTVMIVASWNALPGDALYGTKLALEQTLLVLASPSYAAKGTLQVKYTERRFSEAKRLLADKTSVEGLVYLGNQVDTTTAVITKAPDAKTQKELAQTYIETLQTVAVQLEQQKQVVAAAPVTQSQPVSQAASLPAPVVQQRVSLFTAPQQPVVTSAPVTQTVKPIATQAPSAQANVQPKAPSQATQQASTTAAPPAVTQAVVVAQINQTQEKVKETIKEMEKVAKEAEQQERREEQEEKREEKREEHRDDNRGGGGQNNKGNSNKDD